MSSGMVLGNLRIAEDRVLSYAAVLKTPEPRHMGLVPDSVFYFESELRLQSLVLQRRRWLNGSVAGYLWMIVKEPKILFHMTADNFRKIYVWFLMLLQLLLFALEWISPLMFGYGTRVSLIFGYGLKQWTGYSILSAYLSHLFPICSLSLLLICALLSAVMGPSSYPLPPSLAPLPPLTPSSPTIFSLHPVQSASSATILSHHPLPPSPRTILSHPSPPPLSHHHPLPPPSSPTTILSHHPLSPPSPPTTILSYHPPPQLSCATNIFSHAPLPPSSPTILFHYRLPPSSAPSEVAGGCFMGLYAVFSLVHWKKKFNSPLWALAFIASVAAITIQLSGLIYYMVVNADTNGVGCAGGMWCGLCRVCIPSTATTPL